MSTNRLARSREEFLSSGVTTSGVRDEVATSWRRCSSWSIQPGAATPPYNADLNPESRLIRAAAPVLDEVKERLGDLGLSFLLSDLDGRIIDRRVQERSLWSRLDRLHISPGHLFAEDAVGTNGIGTAIELGRSTRIDGHEHYWDVFTGFTCVASPIMDPFTQRTIGVLDVTCLADPENTLLELIVQQAARAIEIRLAEQHSALERALLDQFLLANRRTRGGLIVLSDRVLMANPQASRLFDRLDHPLMWEHASRAMSSPSPVEDELDLGDGQRIGTRTSALRDGTEVIGSLMEIRQIPGPEKALPVRRSHARPRPAGLVGDDRVFLDAYAAAVAGLSRQLVIVSGEPGVGKLALAQELLGPDAPVLDAGTSMATDEVEWLSRVARALAGHPAGLILCHLDLLSDAGVRRLVPLLASSVQGDTRCVLTYTCGAHSTAGALPGLDAERIWLPPLRNRSGDLPRLAAARVGKRRVDPEVVQLFLRMVWPGNIRELFTVLDRAIARSEAKRANAFSLTLDDVPTDIRSSAPRRALTRFEQAEIHAMLDALAETGGNKREAAALLGIARSTLYRKLQNAGIDLANTVF